MNKNEYRRRLSSLLLYCAIILFAVGLIVYTKEISKSAAAGIEMCVNILIPSLFPFFVVSSLAVQSGLASYIGRAFERPMRVLFALPGACAPAFILGLIGGYPVGAKTAISLHEQGLCSKNQAQRLLSFCNNSGPAFILGAVGATVFSSAWAGVLLYGAHILASITVGILSRVFAQGERSCASPPVPISTVSAKKVFVTAVSSSFSSVINICGFVIFFAVVVRLLSLCGLLPFLSHIIAPLFPSLACAESLLSGLLEVTGGINSLGLAAAGIRAKLTLSAFMLGWAGFSVHFQVLNFIGESGLSTAPYIIGKLLHGCLSAVYIWLALYLLPFDPSISASLSLTISRLSTMTAAPSFWLSLCTSAGAWTLLCIPSIIFRQKRVVKR